MMVVGQAGDREGSPVKITMTLMKDSENPTEVHYGGEEDRHNPLLAGGIVLGRASLPDPVPELLRLSLEWEVAPAAPPLPFAAEPRGVPAGRSPGAQWPQSVKAGDPLVVIKSTIAGPNSPPEWLQQYLGRTGIVLWTTADGAMLDFEGKASWFSFKELKPAP